MPPEVARRATRVALAPQPAETVGGALDRVYDRRVTGWAWDRRAPNEPIEVEVTLDGAPIARGRADRLRDDLAQNGIGNGHHAFDIRVEHVLPTDAKHRVGIVAISAQGERRVNLVNREAPQAIVAAAEPPPILVTAVPEALGHWLDDFRVVQASLENALISAVKQVRSTSNARLAEVGQDARRVGEAIESLQTAQALFTRQLETMEAVQLRIDEALAAVRSAEAEKPRRDASERWLKRVVALLALVSLSALGLGVYSFFG